MDMVDGKLVENVMNEAIRLLTTKPAKYIVDSAEVYEMVDAASKDIENFILYIKTKYGEVELRTDGRIAFIDEKGNSFVRYITDPKITKIISEIYNECMRCFEKDQGW